MYKLQNNNFFLTILLTSAILTTMTLMTQQEVIASLIDIPPVTEWKAPESLPPVPPVTEWKAPDVGVDIPPVTDWEAPSTEKVKEAGKHLERELKNAGDAVKGLTKFSVQYQFLFQLHPGHHYQVPYIWKEIY